MKKEIVAFRKIITANSTSIIKERLKDDGFVEEIRIRFYPGVEKSLQVKPYVLHKEQRLEDLFTYPEGTDFFITGDSDYLTFPVSTEFHYDDEIVIEAKNISTLYPYTLAVDVIVSYLGV